MKIKVFNLIMTFDRNINETVVLSVSNDDIRLPFFVIYRPTKLKEEIRYLTKCLFEDPSLSHVELIDVSFLDIQNDILLNYVSSNPEMYDYSSEEDLCILSCIIFTEKNISPYFWKSVKQTEDLKQSKDNDLNLLIDYCVQHTLL